MPTNQNRKKIAVLGEPTISQSPSGGYGYSDVLGGPGLNIATTASHDIFNGVPDVSLFALFEREEDKDRSSLVKYSNAAQIKFHQLCIPSSRPESLGSIEVPGMSNFQGEFKIKSLFDHDFNPQNDRKLTNQLAQFHVVVLAGLTPGSPFFSESWVKTLQQIRAVNSNIKIASNIVWPDLQSRHYDPNGLKQLLGELDWILGKEQDFFRLLRGIPGFPKTDKRGCLRAFFDTNKRCAIVGVKINSTESQVYYGADRKELRLTQLISEEIPLVDITGADDCWAGAFIAQAVVSNTDEPHHHQAARCADTVYSFCIEHEGALRWIDKVDQNSFGARVKDLKMKFEYMEL
jgi:sugar/nucleoside kinase (ribokinase family)